MENVEMKMKELEGQLSVRKVEVFWQYYALYFVCSANI